MLRRLINGLTDIIYPKICLACRQRLKASSIDNLICAKCWGSIQKNAPPFCLSCGRHLAKKSFAKGVCPGCIKKQLNFDRAFSPCAYNGTIKELIHQFKYRGKDYLGKPLSRIMIDFINDYDLPMQYMDLIIPMPLHPTKLREREFNQAEILSRHISSAFNKDIDTGILKRSRLTRTQTDLEFGQRHKNVLDSFCVSDQDTLKNKNILLIDDVLTSGATSSEAALRLKNSGANIVFVLTLAN